ncbi:GntR family transcriptional regulator [Lysinibacillus sphaericus]|uniref:GntR family transcriptional regulator n=1 Tax=Lysinibacillus sphaericus TaxID=1421 RepID=UPI000C180668|nr:GntR family transcriptional regulator [Lysinibacillus sphaericus]MDM5350801.1 GntR family transcriptional regulator [Lysinibacillus sphaericus]PIJ99979.1 GntR family transcriptional regulator [Lysinibacillus sphaericus]
MNVKVNRKSKIPYYQQLTQQLLLSITTGNLKKGDHLPSIRQLAAQTNLNLHTVHKSYKELQKKGIITIKAHSRAVVSVDSSKAKTISLQQLSMSVEQILIEAYLLGIKEGQLEEMFQESLRKYYTES